MNIFVPIIVTLSVVAVLARICVLFSDKIKFFAKGYDYGFLHVEISTMWKLAKKCKIKDPQSLFVSIPLMNRCISMLIAKSRRDGTENTFKVQKLLENLYKFRTRIALASDKKHGLESTKYLVPGQRLSIILKGKGVFNSKVVNSARELAVTLPSQRIKGSGVPVVIPEKDWELADISVYLWRKEDAAYSFTTTVLGSGFFRSESVLFLKQSSDLVRSQKRQSIRCKCEIYAQLFIIKSEVTDYSAVDTQDGFKCLLEDISEDGALIRTGGKGHKNVRIKLQFQLEGILIMMYGVVRDVEYNAALNQSRLHFECTHIDPSMRNSILTYVYNIIPQEQKDVHDALELATEEEDNPSEKPDSAQS